MAELGEWATLVRAGGSVDEIRSRLQERVAGRLFQSFSENSKLHDLDRIIVRDSARAWAGMLDPRNEQLAGFSVLEAMVETLLGRTPPALSPAFFADVAHLVAGVDGRFRMHESDEAEPTSQAGRAAALLRSDLLDRLGEKAQIWQRRYRSGLEPDIVRSRSANRKRILDASGAGQKQWSDWRWQARTVATTAEALGKWVGLSDEERDAMGRAAGFGMPLGVTPYYASLMDPEPGGDRDRAVRAQVIPPIDFAAGSNEGDGGGDFIDFMQEGDTSPVASVTRRYPAIAILKPCTVCPQVCIYCQRNWELDGVSGDVSEPRLSEVDAALDWLSEHSAIRDVLVTGGDPFILSDNILERILRRLSEMPHVEQIRFGTRTLVTMPMRITEELAALVSSFRKPGERNVSIMTHIQHPYEVTPELVEAVNRLRQRGLSVYNQLVYTLYSSRRFEAVALRRLLRRVGVDPYYSFYPKAKSELASYRVPIARMLQEQKEEARLSPGLERTDEPVYNVPALGKNHLNAWQHRDLLSVHPDGARVWEFHPWEKKILPQSTYVGRDVAILDYLRRLAVLGEDPRDYESIWYYL